MAELRGVVHIDNLFGDYWLLQTTNANTDTLPSSSFNYVRNTTVYSQKYKCQYANNNGRIVVLFPLENFVQWQHKLTVTFKVLLQFTELLSNKSQLICHINKQSNYTMRNKLYRGTLKKTMLCRPVSHSHLSPTPADSVLSHRQPTHTASQKTRQPLAFQ